MYVIKTTDVFDIWFDSLKDKLAKARINARLRRAEIGNLGDVAPVGHGISEMRLFFGTGYRIYFRQAGDELIVLLVGGDKSTQKQDIQTARKILQALEIEYEKDQFT